MSNRRTTSLYVTLLLASATAFAQDPNPCSVGMANNPPESDLAQPAPIPKIIHEFNGADLSAPSSNLVQLPNGDFIGMTAAPINKTSDSGTVYAVTSNGVHIIRSLPADGSLCAGSSTLMQATDGNLYGVCGAGGRYGLGTVFRLTKTGRFNVLHHFAGSDGMRPGGILAEGLDGNLYGTALNGGLSYTYGGTIFRVNFSGDFATLMKFDFNTGPSNPTGGLVVGPGGSLHGLYGCFQCNGTNPGPGGNLLIDAAGGITFPGSFLETPWSGAPVVGHDGSDYAVGQAQGGCASQNQALQKLAAGAPFSKTIMHLPGQYRGDAVNYYGGMIQAGDGLFYMNGNSAISNPMHPYVEIQLDPATRARNFFTLDAYGSAPVLAPMQAADGKLYIVNGGGGKFGQGNILTLDYGLSAPKPKIVAFSPNRAPAGTLVTIWGGSFVGVTAVTLEGVTAPFQVLGSGFVQFTVPPGAGSGHISVTNAGGTTISADRFKVL